MIDLQLPRHAGNASSASFSPQSSGGAVTTGEINVHYDPRGVDRLLAASGLPRSDGMEVVCVAQPESSFNAWRCDVGVYSSEAANNGRAAFASYLGTTADGWEHQKIRFPVTVKYNLTPMPGANEVAPYLRVHLVDGREVNVWLTDGGNIKV